MIPCAPSSVWTLPGRWDIVSTVLLYLMKERGSTGASHNKNECNVANKKPLNSGFHTTVVFITYVPALALAPGPKPPSTCV